MAPISSDSCLGSVAGRQAASKRLLPQVKYQRRKVWLLTEKHTGNLTTFDFPLLCIDFRFLVMITGKKSLPAFSLRQLFCQ